MLSEANTKLNNANKKLSGIRAKVKELQDRVAALEETLLPLALGMASDPVPNLRLILASALQRAAPHISSAALVAQVIPALEALVRDDDDMDVLGASQEALEACLALVHS